jgi:hypothetical protein
MEDITTKTDKEAFIEIFNRLDLKLLGDILRTEDDENKLPCYAEIIKKHAQRLGNKEAISQLIVRGFN